MRSLAGPNGCVIDRSRGYFHQHLVVQRPWSVPTVVQFQCFGPPNFVRMAAVITLLTRPACQRQRAFAGQAPAEAERGRTTSFFTVPRFSGFAVLGWARSLYLNRQLRMLDARSESEETSMTTIKPNILILWGDDIGWWNISYNSRGQMGYPTPNIDRVAHEGVAITDYYGQQSCTVGRAAFITGQNPIRTGLTKVGMPGADIGLQAEDPTIAELLKPRGYRTG